MMWTEEEFEKLKNGDTRAFEKLYDLYKDKLYRFFIVKTGGDQDLACELLSQTVYSAIQAVRTLTSCKNLQGLLFQIAVRRYNDHLRRTYRSAGSDMMESFSDTSAAGREEEIIEKEKIAVLYIALDRIKPEYREILEMKYFNDRSEKEIAAAVGKSVGAIEGLLYRARQALKKELGSNAELFSEGL